MDVIKRLHEIDASPEWKRADSIWDAHYEGRPVSAEDQKFFDGYVNTMLDENRTLQSFELSITLVYMSKYVSS